MVAQDTGGAIKGPVRGDVFWGGGKEAEEQAGSDAKQRTLLRSASQGRTLMHVTMR